MQTITIDLLPRSLDAMSTRTTTLLPVMKAGRLMGEAEVKQRFTASQGPTGLAWPALKFPRPNGGNAKPLMNLGLLRGSITGRETENTIAIGTALPQAPLMHFGGVVRPKKGRFLSIPLTTAAVRSGGPRRFGSPLHARFARNGRTGILVDNAGAEQFLLVQSVTVPPRPFMGFSDKWVEKFRRALAEFIATGRF